MRGIKAILGSAVLVVGAVVAYGAINSTVQARDCSANSVVKCGTYSITELRKNFNKNKSVRNIFSHFGITSNTVNKLSYKNGYVTKNGNVVVGGKTVATNAMTAGRQYIKPSTKKKVGGTTFYARSAKTSFRSSQLSAFVFFNKDGSFAGAVVKDCGNPISGTNKVPPKPKKIKVCDLKTKKIVSINKKDFNKKKHSKNLDDCKAKPAPKKIKVCDLKSKKIVTINEKDFNKSKHSKNLEDCKEKPAPKKIQVCELESKDIVTIDEKDFDKSKHSLNLDDCKEVPTPPKNIEVCDLDSGKVVSIKESEFNKSKHTTDLSKCDTPETPPETPPTPPETPEAPAELPETGASDIVSAGLGLGAVIAAVSYYVASRRYLG